MEKIIFDILEIVVIVVATLIGRYVIPYFKNKVDMQKVEQIVAWAKRFVIMAENVIKGQGKGADKRDFVAKLLAEKAKELKSIDLQGFSLVVVFTCFQKTPNVLHFFARFLLVSQ